MFVQPFPATPYGRERYALSDQAESFCTAPSSDLRSTVAAAYCFFFYSDLF